MQAVAGPSSNRSVICGSQQ